jgi:hypothetical protein
MSHRPVVAIAATFALLLAGCGGAEQQAAAPSAADKLDAGACADLTNANLDLATATSGQAAQAAADVFGRYDPPADVRESIDHVVKAGGVKFDGPDFDLINDHIDPWVAEVCPE